MLYELVEQVGALAPALRSLPDGIAHTAQFKKFWRERVEPVQVTVRRAAGLLADLDRQCADQSAQEWAASLP